MLGRVEDFGRGADFKDLAVGHEDHAVGHGAGEAHFVGHADHGHAFLGEVHHNVQHFADHFRVEGGGGFVEEHELGLHGKGAGDGHALLLAAGEHGGVDVGLVADAHALEQFHAKSLGVLFGHAAQLDGGHGQVVQNSLVGEEVELLEHHAHVLTDLVDVVLRVVDVHAVHSDEAAVDLLKAVDGAQHGGLAGAGRTDDNDLLAAMHIEGNVLQGRHLAEELPDVLDADDGLVTCVCHSSSACLQGC